MPAPIKKLADKFLSNPKTVEVSRPASANASIDQRIFRVDARKKKDVLTKLLKREEIKTAIIFCNRKTTVRELTQSLKRSGFAAGQIHGDMEQAERIAELDRFKNEEINILVASDVAARGLDVKGVSHVFNFDVPWQPDDYIHRIGRTGRAGKTGTAITLASKEDAEAIASIEKLMGMSIPALDAVAAVAAPAEPTAAEAKPAKPKAERPRTEKPQLEKARVEEPKAEKPKAEKPRTDRSKSDRSKSDRPKTERGEAEKREAKPRAQSAAATPAVESDIANERTPELETAEEGWNGPVPSFLGQGFGG
jgi:superfamily II DNA/RNA helicase